MTHLIYYTLMFVVATDLMLTVTGIAPAIARAAKIATAGIALAGCLFVTRQAGRPPLYGPFETSTALVLIISALALLFGRHLDTKKYFWGISATFSLIILLIQLPRPLTLNANYYMYDNIWVILFFFLRLTGIGVLIHGAAQYLAGIVDTRHRAVLWAGGRNTLLTAICIYLTGEWAGSLWCLNWLGDSWRWSKGFFKASLVFLLVMAACHLPRRGSGRTHLLLRGITGALPGIFGIYMLFYH